MYGRDLTLTHVRRFNENMVFHLSAKQNSFLIFHITNHRLHKHFINMDSINEWISNPSAIRKSSHENVQIEKLICICFHPELNLNANIIHTFYVYVRFQLICFFNFFFLNLFVCSFDFGIPKKEQQKYGKRINERIEK